MTTSSDVSLQMYASPQCLTSGGLLLSLGCFPTGISDGQQIKECIMNSDKFKFIISDKLEVLSELHNDGKISQGNTISVNYSMV